MYFIVAFLLVRLAILYYYQTDDDTIRPGDAVILPVWPEDNGGEGIFAKGSVFRQEKRPFSFGQNQTYN